MVDPIALVLLTGFLGAGKTTLLNSMLSRATDGRTGILVNEFGTVGVDGALIRKSGSDDGMTVYEVADGSIFCTCKSASFVAGLRMFARLPETRRPERLVVEASGMSDPSGLTKLLRDNRLAGDYAVTKIVCLVDAVRFQKVVSTLPAVRRQVEAADTIVINKVDLLEEADPVQVAEPTQESSVEQPALRALESKLRAMNGDAEILRTSFGRISDTVWSGVSKDLAGELVSCTTPETRPASLHLRLEDDCGGADCRDAVDRFLRAAVARTYRIKGWLAIDGQWYFISDNSGRIEWESQEPPAGAQPGLVVISAPERADEVAELWRDATAGAAERTIPGGTA